MIILEIHLFFTLNPINLKVNFHARCELVVKFFMSFLYQFTILFHLLSVNFSCDNKWKSVSSAPVFTSQFTIFAYTIFTSFLNETNHS